MLPPCNRHHAISCLFANDPPILRFFFNPDQTERYFSSPQALVRVARNHFDRGQNVLILLALDIWEGTRRARMIDLARALDGYQIECALLAIEVLRAAGGCQCQNCRQRLSETSCWEPEDSSLI